MSDARRQWRIDALFWAYLIFDDDPVCARARVRIVNELLELGVIP